MTSSAHVAAASLNQTVGDWQGNARRITEVLHATRERGAQLLILPEGCVSGYSLGDRLHRSGTLEHAWRVLRQVQAQTAGLIACVGLPIAHRGLLYNAMAVLADGQLAGLVCKENLAVGDVEYESRWYQPWPHGRAETFEAPDGEHCPIGTLIYHAQGLGRLALEICEDGWLGIRPGSVYALAGAEILGNPSASWFTIGKHRVRRGLVEQVSREDKCLYLYSSLLGCDATRLVFDGSVLIASDGQVLDEGRRFLFREDWDLVDRVVDLGVLRRARREQGSWREQVRRLHNGDYGPLPTEITLPGQWGSDAQPSPDAPYWLQSQRRHVDPSLRWLDPAGDRIAETDLPHLELELALSLGLRDYLAKTRVPGVVVALSGGKDSAMVAVLVHRMLAYEGALEATPERLAMAYMGTENSGPTTLHAARTLATALGATWHELDVQRVLDESLVLAEQLNGGPLSWDDPVHDLALQNVQARVRGVQIWMLANLRRALLLTTSNKSEAAVGYTTMDGDTSGGLAPIADVPKSLVTTWLSWARDFHGLDALDPVIAQAPTAELRPAGSEQTDEGDLMPFAVLDRLMYEFVQQGRDPVDLFDVLWPEFSDRYDGVATAFAADIRTFVTLLCRAQWKRERFAISFRVTAFDLDPKTGFRFPAVQAPFLEELAALDAHVAALGGTP